MTTDGADSDLLRRFMIVAGGFALLGVALAVAADHWKNSIPVPDATREIGGAMVAGATVAALVVWFEQRREDERVQREETRDGDAALSAWFREIDLRLIRLVNADLQEARHRWLDELEYVEFHHTTLAIGGLGEPEYSSTLDRPTREVATLLDLLGDDDLSRSFSHWRSAAGAHNTEPYGAAGKRQSEKAVLTYRAEEDAWNEVINATVSYRHRHYPERPN